MATYAADNPAIARLVEKQMRNWEIGRSQRPLGRESQATREVEDFVTISREAGAGGTKVARLLGERLDWPVFDREILHVMAGDDRIRERLYESLDERDTTWLDDAVRWIVRGEFPIDDYFHRLTETVLSLARQGRSVFLGRAGDLILPPNRGLRIQVVAPSEYCIREIARRESVSESHARRLKGLIDNDRREFVRRHFKVEADRETRFDVALGMGRLTAAAAVDVILSAMTARNMEIPEHAGTAGDGL